VKRISRFLVFVAVAAGSVAAALWLLRERIAGPPVDPVRSHDEAPRLRPVPHRSEAPQAEPTSTPEADDLTAVNGIGPVYRSRLADHGITTFAGLAAADAATVAALVETRTASVEDWIRQAAELAG
jgi:predicted flap endonuclease-1-like 5' DNA nuclease